MYYFLIIRTFIASTKNGVRQSHFLKTLKIHSYNSSPICRLTADKLIKHSFSANYHLKLRIVLFSDNYNVHCFNYWLNNLHPKNYTTCTKSYVLPIVGITWCGIIADELINSWWKHIGAISTNSWRVSKFWQYLQTLYRTTILEFNRFLTDFGNKLSNYKSEQLLPSSIIGSWWFFRARVDQLHMSNNASHIFFSVNLPLKYTFFSDIKLNFNNPEQFLRLAHRLEILCWTQKSYGVWNATTNHESTKIWRNLNFWN
jgi:hypothetical protein